MSPKFKIHPENKILKITIWGPEHNYYFSLWALHLLHEKTCIAKTKNTETKQNNKWVQGK